MQSYIIKKQLKWIKIINLFSKIREMNYLKQKITMMQYNTMRMLSELIRIMEIYFLIKEMNCLN